MAGRRQLRKDEILLRPIVRTDRVGFIRGDRVDEVLWLSYAELLAELALIFTGGGGGNLLLQVNGTNNVVQTLLNLVNGTGVSIVDNGDGSVTISAAGLVSANNGLTVSGTTVQLGGATLGTGNLIRDSYITNDGFVFRIDQTTGNALFLNTATGAGLRAIVGSGIGVRSTSNSGIAIEGLSFDDVSLLLIRETAGTNDVIGLLKGQRNTTGTAFAGIGGALELWIEHRQTVPAPAPTVPTATFEGIWQNPGPLVANRVGKFRIRLDLADVQQDILSGLATGEITLEKYGIGTFTGTPTFNLAVDANGKVIEVASGGGGSLFPYNVRTFITGGNNTSSVLVINSTNRLVVTNQGTSTVNFYNLTTGELVTSTAIGTAYHSIYVSAIGEVWIFNNTVNLFRFNATTGVLIATVAGGVGETFGRGSIDDSVNNRVYVLANGRVIRIDTTTFTPTAVVTAGGILGTDFIAVTSGVLNGYYVGLLAGGVNSRMIVYDRATDTMAVNDNLGGTAILSLSAAIPCGSVLHWTASDRFIVTSANIDRILIVEATTTTLTVVDTIYGIQNPQYAVLNNDESLLFVYSNKGVNVQAECFVSVIDMATLTLIKTINTINIGSQGVFGFQDKANKLIYTVIATSTAGLVNKLIYE